MSWQMADFLRVSAQLAQVCTGALTIDKPGIEIDTSVLGDKIKTSEESHALCEPRAKTKPAWAECPTDSPTAPNCSNQNQSEGPP